MTQREAAELLELSRNSVVRLVKRGVLPTIQLAPGMARRIRRADVLALVDSRRSEET